MKRVIYLIMTVAAICLAATGCNKEKKSKNSSITISWPANTSFARMEITSSMDATINIKAAAGIESAAMKFTKYPASILGDLQKKISISSNKTGGNANTPVFNFVSDSSVESYLKSLGIAAGSALKGKDDVNLELGKLINDMLEGLVIANGEIIATTFTVTDAEGNQASKNMEFRFTSAPELTWKSNADFNPVEVNPLKTDCAITVSAPGKIAVAKLTVTTSSANVKTQIRQYITDQQAESPIIDLIDDSKAVSAFKSQFSMATGTDLKGKTSATLDLNKFIGGFTYWAAAGTASEHTITIYLEDENGKNVTQPIKVQYSPAL